MRIRILGHRIVVLLGMMLMVAGCGNLTSPRPSPRGEGERHPRPAATPSESGNCRTLVLVDSLMWQQPDSAFALLIDFAVSPEADSLDGFDGHYFQLLASELLYKNYCEQSNRKDLLRAVAYFDSIADLHGAGARGVSVWPFQRRDASHASAQTKAFLAARAHYINGVGYYERDSVVEACAEYLETLELMEDYFEKKELVGHKARFMANTNNRLGDMFSEQYMMESAITCYEKALDYCRIEPTSVYGVSYILSRIGLQYHLLGNDERMIEYYESALDEMPDTNNLIYRDLTASKALVDYQSGLGIDHSLELLRQVMTCPSDESERLTRFLTIGAIYAEEGMYDSALYYLETVLGEEEDDVSRIQAAENLRVIYESYGETEKLDSCLHFLALRKASESETKALVSKLEDQFENHTKREYEKLQEHEKWYAVRKTVVAIAFMAIIAITIVIITSRRRNKKRMLAQKTENEKMLERIGKRHEEELVRKDEETARLLLEKDRQREREAQKHLTDTQLHLKAFLDEPVCCKINGLVRDVYLTTKDNHSDYPGITLDENTVAELGEAVSKHFRGFKEELLCQYPDMKQEDFLLCYLYLLGLENKQIAILRRCHYSTVSRQTIKLAKSFGIKGDLKVFVKDLALS